MDMLDGIYTVDSAGDICSSQVLFKRCWLLRARLHGVNQWEVCKILQVLKWVIEPYLHWGDAQAEIE
ncbi:hypothetical protein PHLCEN_2v10026 [Hermanssonia centrifuga]|uniref:Uncharacterized protein n=1 Tax=Hermanssonia centrifuga TaxID=98765 RepID=A0A2R6NP31_9APHY|nr:hypothetical protein PHLCEN_2v10026 [Hermanssonia centrifuga]